MAPILFKCKQCGKTVRIPEGRRVPSVVRCPACNAHLEVPLQSTVGEPSERKPEVPRQPAGGQPTERKLEVLCRDCNKVFKVPASERGQVVSCPSCGSWVKAGEARPSILYHEVPMPFQFSTSIRRWLRFLAGFTLLGGLVVAVCVGAFYGTTVHEAADGSLYRGINPAGVLVAFGVAVGAILGSVVLMALYWILQNVTAIHYATTQRDRERP